MNVDFTFSFDVDRLLALEMDGVDDMMALRLASPSVLRTLLECHLLPATDIERALDELLGALPGG